MMMFIELITPVCADSFEPPGCQLVASMDLSFSPYEGNLPPMRSFAAQADFLPAVDNGVRNVG